MTGPTGSGKTTTLYALLNTVVGTQRNIITLEDPIEYELKGIVQSQIDAEHDYTFSSGLRSILRHDPNIILLGEIRDLETAQTAVDASLTGHLVLATLHTNSALEAIPRLLSMGVVPYTFAPALRAILAQRLVRTLSPECAGSPMQHVMSPTTKPAAAAWHSRAHYGQPRGSVDDPNSDPSHAILSRRRRRDTARCANGAIFWSKNAARRGRRWIG